MQVLAHFGVDKEAGLSEAAVLQVSIAVYRQRYALGLSWSIGLMGTTSFMSPVIQSILCMAGYFLAVEQNIKRIIG